MELSFVLEPLIAAKARANQSIAGGDKKSCSAKSLSPKCEKAVEAIHTDEELAKLSGISRNTIRRAKVIKEHGTPEQIERARVDGCENLTAQFCAVTCSTGKWCRSVQIWTDRVTG